jgi:DNA modification methylase
VRYLHDPDFDLYLGDAAEELAQVESETVDCCITSPPYYAQRDYQTGAWSGGSDECTHEAARKKTRYDYSLAASPIHGRRAQALGTDAQAAMFAESCPACGARRIDKQIGLEASPEAYVEKLIGVFQEVRRVLKPEGTLWVNLGDKIENKDLVGAPWLFAFAMKREGWILRRDIIWAKQNVMPESCKDRPTCAHEYIFLFSKQTSYFYNYEATLEPHSENRWGGPIALSTDGYKGGTRVAERDGRSYFPGEGRNTRSVWNMPTESLPDAHYAPFPQELVKRCIDASCPEGGIVLDPFLGSGTTAFVARKMGRRCIGIELSPEYAKLIWKRTQQQSLFAKEGHDRETVHQGSDRDGTEVRVEDGALF